MYAVVGIWTAAEEQREEQERGLHEQVIPIVKAHPGFVAGYWMREPETGKGHTMIVLDSEVSAQRFKELVLERSREQAQAGITNDLLAVADILAEA